MADWRDRRRQAAWRRRRIIMNNDGDDACGRAIPSGVEPTTEAFLAQRCTGLENSQVDSLFYCTGGNFNLHSFESQFGELFIHPVDVRRGRDLTRHWIDRGRDALGMVVDFCRAHDKEIIWSLRINDIHDNWYPAMMPRFKKDHPEMLLFQPDDVDLQRPSPDWSEPHMLATAVDYAHDEVRTIQLGLIEEVCSRYDVDGIELDFMRNPTFFRPTLEGRPCADEHIAIMTGFVRQVRDLTERFGRERDRPLVIACRLPSRVACCRNIGLDVEHWLADDLIDVMVSCLEFDAFIGPIGELVELGHRHDVPVYANLSDSCFSLPNVPDRLEAWAGAATRAYNAGADGIYTFNNFDPNLATWKVIGDPAALTRLDKVYAVDNLAGRFRTWEPAYRRDGGLPVNLPGAVDLYVGDDVGANAPRQMSLCLVVEHMTWSDKIAFRLNDHLLDPVVDYTTEGVSPQAVSTFGLHVDVDAAQLRLGANHFTADVESALDAPMLTGLQLLIRYSDG